MICQSPSPRPLLRSACTDVSQVPTLLISYVDGVMEVRPKNALCTSLAVLTQIFQLRGGFYHVRLLCTLLSCLNSLNRNSHQTLKQNII
jgi:flagellar biosynthesis component FlhA